MICASKSTFAQGRFSIEIRPGVNFATQKLGQATLETGYGIEGVVAYRFLEHLGVYAGWGWNKFGSDQKINGTNLDFEETGYTFGLQFIHPIGSSKIQYLIRAGGLANHIEVEEGDEIISDSGHGFGWQVEGGFAIPLGENFRLMPSVRYRALSRDITLETITTAVDLNYISAGLGLTWVF
ncbi:MAG: outer membrane beta-barrel protein [Saprospiraceae bacterium]|nr:outer membrane beta-barrel protein [Saprospiraceae bacterium]